MSATPYRRVWRWHFFAGLLVAPALLLLALTGALYLFDDAIDTWWLGDLATVAPVTAARPLAEQEAAVRRAHPGARLVKYLHPAASDRAAQWSLRSASGKPLDVFVDPSDARVLGAVDSTMRPMAIVVRLHGERMAGRLGDTLVEAASCWALVLVVTGLYLWWPRRWRWQGVVVPRLQHPGRRRWRDLHAVTGALNAVFVVFLVASGLPWSGLWGEQLASLGRVSALTAPSPNFSVTVHLGRQFGGVNQFVALVACALMAVAVVAGAVSWWRRRPAGGLGAPQAPADERLPRGLVVGLATMAVLFPLVGASLAVAWSLDTARRRWATPVRPVR